MLPTDAVTDQLSGKILRLRRVREWRASGLGSIKLLKHGLQKATVFDLISEHALITELFSPFFYFFLIFF